MENRTHRQAGFGLVGILIIVAAVLIVGGIGFVISNHYTKTAPASATTAPPSPPTNKNPSPTSAQPAPPSAAQPYVLTVKEWGVQIPLPDAIKDAYYVVSTSTSDADGTPNTILLGLKSLDALGCKADDANHGKKPLAMIGRSALGATDPVYGKPYTELDPNGVTIGNYYYAYLSWASTNTCAPKATLQTMDSNFTATIKHTTTATTKAAN